MASFEKIIKSVGGFYSQISTWQPPFSCTTDSYGRISGLNPNPVWGGGMQSQDTMFQYPSAFNITGNQISGSNLKTIASIPIVDDNDNIITYFQVIARLNGNTTAIGIAFSTNAGTYTQDTAHNQLFGNYWGDSINISSTIGAENYYLRPCIFRTANEDYIGLLSLYYYNGTSYIASLGGVSGVFGVSMSKIESVLGGHVSEEYYSEEFGKPSEEGGYTGGTFDDSSDTIAIPSTPSIGVTSAGFVNVYNPTVGSLQNFGSELFPDLTFSQSSHISGSTGVSEAIEAAANALVDLGNQIPNIVNMYINSNLIQYVIDCHILPVAPTTTTATNIKVGFRQFNTNAPVVTSDYVDFDCGSLNIGEYYANFIDYAPYTRAKLFLPFIGFVDLQPEYFQSGTINIKYRFNIIDGSFMAYVLSTSSKSKLSNSVIMQFGGNACVHIPITGLNYSSMVSGVVSGAAAVISSQSGGGGNPIVDKMAQAATTAADVANMRPPVQQSNGYNSTTSFLSVRTPYLLIERSVSNFSVSYSLEKGIPSNITTSFSGLSGFTQATNIHLDGIPCTEAEKNEIAALLAGGVIL